jgi:hypothetical protein
MDDHLDCWQMNKEDSEAVPRLFYFHIPFFFA